MMQRYNSSSQGQYCHSCGMFHHHSQSCCYGNNAGSFSTMFSPMHNGGVLEQNNTNSNCTDYYSSSSVDCTLSLGTPSTRLCEEDEKRRRSNSSGGSSCMSNFWDLLHPKHTSKTAPYNVPAFSTNNGKSTRGGSGGGGGDPLLARRCANCDTTSTPLWRNGPRGPKSLCNACGIRFKKEERRSTAVSGGAAPVAADHYANHSNFNYHNATGNASWVHHPPAQRVPCYAANEIRFIDDVGSGAGDFHHRDSDASHAVPFLSWRLNVADRASLVHDFTR